MVEGSGVGSNSVECGWTVLSVDDFLAVGSGCCDVWSAGRWVWMKGVEMGNGGDGKRERESERERDVNQKCRNVCSNAKSSSVNAVRCLPDHDHRAGRSKP